ncbi:LOW QUALITY PROTEIN: Hypothetical protein PHPALM_683 [Phytophthora palmivora]|uniref:Uncharacterized protein n=1 Tax=Phytophthora palmivora TaxID=4796 RepID=A0A2P4YU92_9STRA|nr:LOW QUALITY PROTEIN: Hypothetical protein PHPALM_683 [Phytophthora palmivora]
MAPHRLQARLFKEKTDLGKAPGGYSYRECTFWYRCALRRPPYQPTKGDHWQVTKLRHPPRHIKHIERALIEVHADNHIADRFIEQVSVLRLLELLCPGVTYILPSWRVLGTRILKEHALCAQVHGAKNKGWDIHLSDVWQNISKDHLLGCQLALFGVILTYGLIPAGDDSNKLFCQHRQKSGVLEPLSLITRGSVGLLAASWRFDGIVFVFCFAHDVNNLVKAVLRSSFSDVAAQAATTVKTLNASTSKWLSRARKLMQRVYGKHVGLRTLCKTRWNSMQGCFASFLRVQSAVQLLFRQHRNDSNVPENLRVFAEAIIAPLSYASYCLQRDQNTVGDIVLSLRDIYKGFKQHLVRHDELLESFEYRWAQIEQPLFMLGFGLHPDYASLA